MKQFTKKRVLVILVTFVFAFSMLVGTTSLAAQPPVNLGLTSTYAILAGTTITNTGTSVINGSAGGDVGLHSGTAFPGQAGVTISGAVHLGDAVALAAKNALLTAYNDADGRIPVTTIAAELGGTTLNPGVYVSEQGYFQITGTLTLDALGDPDGVFIFKTDSTLITASASNIALLGSARYCRTFWKVGSSATLGTNSHFVGHIFALTSIAAQTGATIQGQLLARNGAVTLDSNTITNGLCAAAASPTPVGSASPTPEVSGAPTPSPAITGETTPAPTADRTVTGGELPQTGTPFFELIISGFALILTATFIFIVRKRYEYARNQK